MHPHRLLFVALLIGSSLQPVLSQAQFNAPDWNKNGNSYTSMENNALVETTLPAMTKTTLVSAEQLAIPGQNAEARESGRGRGGRGGGGETKYMLSDDQQKVLLYTNPRREYHNTFYSCWVFDRKNNQLSPVAKNLPPSSLLNAKLSPDGSKVAYVYGNNIYMEDLATGTGSGPSATGAAPIALTTDGNDKKLNAWFDYAYSEELYTIDGFRWSPDSRQIAYWQMDLSKVGIFYMINNTDSIYPKIIPIPFSKVGTPIAEAKIGVLTVATKATKWMNIEGDPASHYIDKMEWTPDGSRIIVQQLNRAQNNSKLILCNPATGDSKLIYNETDEAWIDILPFWSHFERRGEAL